MTQAPSPPTPPGPGGMRPHRGTMILVFGILSIACCLIFGIVAWVMANGDLEAMQTGQMDPSGEGMTKAGKICGIIGIVLQGLSAVAYLLLLILGIGLGLAGASGGAGGGAGP